jgi:hypothetical protein
MLHHYSVLVIDLQRYAREIFHRGIKQRCTSLTLGSHSISNHFFES